MNYRINIIGAGIAGLAASIRLASRGHRVTVFERNPGPGGKLNSMEWNGYRWDTGPTLFTLPDLVEELYVMAGEEMKISVRARKLDPVCRYFYEDGRVLDAFGDPALFAREAEKVLGEPASSIRRLLERRRRIFELTSDVFIFKNFRHAGTFLSQKAVKAILQFRKLDAMVTMHDANRRDLKSDQVLQLFDRYATYHGSDPYRAPGTLNVIAHLEHNMGVYCPERGMYSLVTELKHLADKLGVVFHFNQPVEKVVMDRRITRGVVVKGGIYPSDIVVSDIDIFYLYRDLLEDVPFPAGYFKKEKSNSALVFFWAMDATFPRLGIHNVFFSKDHREEFRVLSLKQKIPVDPTVYIYISSKMVRSDAPEGKENWHIMVNAPENLGQDWDRLVEEARRSVLDKLGRILGVDMEPFILKEFVFDPRSMEATTGSYRGALYGNSSNSRLAVFSRHPNYLRRYGGLYFVGGSVHPGGGIPLCLASARIVDQYIHR